MATQTVFICDKDSYQAFPSVSIFTIYYTEVNFMKLFVTFENRKQKMKSRTQNQTSIKLHNSLNRKTYFVLHIL